jgi:CheY-like chemotaxis protein
VKAEIRDAADQKGLQLEFHPDRKVSGELLGDKYMLQQILINLGRNAVEYTNTGRVDISSNLNGSTDNIAVLGFTVKDTGIGIDKELHNKIFNSFIGETAFDKKTFAQSGLELVIIRQMLELQGGTITVDSKPGVGTTFYFEIPFEINFNETNKTEEPDAPRRQTTSVDNISILLVEDNEFNVMVAKDELEDAIDNVIVDVAENGQIALEKIIDNDYHIILMDVQMPVMNGYDATREIRKMNNSKGRTPIIAMTANILKAEIDKCFEAGMNAYIPKPFERDELILRIRENLA